MKAKIEAINYYLPENIVTNHDLQKENPEWIMDKLYEYSGVSERHIALEEETALDLAEKACLSLFDDHPDLREKVDGILFCTQSPDHLIPSNACILHGRLDLPANVFALDINMSCSGFVYGLNVAHGLIAAGSVKNLLFITADTYSKYIHPQDRATRILFGDGAAVTWLTPSEDAQGIMDIQCGTLGKSYDAAILPAGACRLPHSEDSAQCFTDKSGNVKSKDNLHLDGLHVFMFSKSRVVPQLKSLLKKNQLTTDDISMYFFHQASQGIIDSLQRQLKLPPEKVYNSLKCVGNTVSSSIPISLSMAWSENKVQRGDLIVLEGFGAGMSWGTAILEL